MRAESQRSQSTIKIKERGGGGGGGVFLCCVDACILFRIIMLHVRTKIGRTIIFVNLLRRSIDKGTRNAEDILFFISCTEAFNRFDNMENC